MNFIVGDVIQYHNEENNEGLYWKVYIINQVLNTVIIVGDGIRILKTNAVKL